MEIWIIVPPNLHWDWFNFYWLIVHCPCIPVNPSCKKSTCVTMNTIKATRPHWLNHHPVLSLKLLQLFTGCSLIVHTGLHPSLSTSNVLKGIEFWLSSFLYPLNASPNYRRWNRMMIKELLMRNRILFANISSGIITKMNFFKSSSGQHCTGTCWRHRKEKVPNAQKYGGNDGTSLSSCCFRAFSIANYEGKDFCPQRHLPQVLLFWIH